jgi:hypothetical protein
VHAAPDRPSVIGSTGHVLGEAMDVLDEQWADDTLRIRVAPGRPYTGVVHVAVPPAWRHLPDALDPITRGASGTLLRIPFNPNDPREIRLQFEPVTA